MVMVPVLGSAHASRFVSCDIGYEPSPSGLLTQPPHETPLGRTAYGFTATWLLEVAEPVITQFEPDTCPPRFAHDDGSKATEPFSDTLTLRASGFPLVS